MAERQGELTFREDNIGVLEWTGLLNGDTGEEAVPAGLEEMTVQTVGTFGAGGTATLQGSNDGTNWATLVDAQGADVILSDTTIASIGVFPLFIRPSVAGGDGTTNLTVTIVGRRVGV